MLGCCPSTFHLTELSEEKQKNDRGLLIFSASFQVPNCESRQIIYPIRALNLRGFNKITHKIH